MAVDLHSAGEELRDETLQALLAVRLILSRAAEDRMPAAERARALRRAGAQLEIEMARLRRIAGRLEA